MGSPGIESPTFSPKGNFANLSDLLGSHASEAEHSDLVRDVVPVVGRPVALHSGFQLGSDVDDAISHSFHINKPKKEKQGRLPLT